MKRVIFLADNLLCQTDVHVENKYHKKISSSFFPPSPMPIQNFYLFENLMKRMYMKRTNIIKKNSPSLFFSRQWQYRISISIYLKNLIKIESMNRKQDVFSTRLIPSTTSSMKPYKHLQEAIRLKHQELTLLNILYFSFLFKHIDTVSVWLQT